MAEIEKRLETHRMRCLSKLKMFLLAITCAFVSKTLSGSYMNSMLTQIERQFNIPTSLVGFINGSFEIGNLLLIIFVSYFGTKLHRPILIGVGCVVMGLGCFLQSLPHFLMGRYEYESTVSVSGNLSSNSFLCMENGTQTFRPTEDPSECVKEVKSLMWIYVLVGNIIRGIGETPIMPLGISYIEDFAKSENSPLYIVQRAVSLFSLNDPALSPEIPPAHSPVHSHLSLERGPPTPRTTPTMSEEPPLDLTGKVYQLEVMLKQLHTDLQKEKQDKAVLQSEVASLRQNNQRLQEESQAASEQLRKFAEIFCREKKEL